MGRRVVVNADDLGASTAVNAGVLRALEAGTLRSASLMVTGDAAAEAVDMARGRPDLAVGLHLVLVDGRPTLPPEQLPSLVGADGRFPAAPLRLGLAYALHPAARRQARAEVAAQFDAFAATGLPLSHVDGHLHMHLHPAIFPSVVDLARRHGAAAVRVPRDDIRLAIRAGGFHPRWVGWWASLGPLGWWGRRRGGPAARVVDRVYGLYRSGAIDSGYLLAVLSRPGRSEVYLHPSTADRIPLGPNPGDLEALTDREVRAALDGLGGPATFAGLAA